MLNHVFAAFCLILSLHQAATQADPLLHLPLQGHFSDAHVFGAPNGGVTYVEGPNGLGQGAYLPRGAKIVETVNNVNREEGTVCFWLKPDWSGADYTWHPVFTLVGIDQDFQLDLREGYSAAISPDSTYFNLADGLDYASISWVSGALFTANQWRHYAVRWSRKAGAYEMVVDGCVVYRSGKFPPRKEADDVPITIEATLTMHGTGTAFHGVQVFDHYLDDAALLAASKLKSRARYLSVQTPPTVLDVTENTQTIDYVDPTTGHQVKRTVDEETFLYNPTKVADFPATPHTKWGRPLAGGSIRVLQVSPNGFYDRKSMLREGIELWQRLDIDCDIVDRGSPEVFAQDYDVIIVTHQGYSNNMVRGWSDLDEPLRRWIIERVSSGKSGLIVSYPIRLDDEINALMKADARIASDDLVRGFPAAAVNQFDLITANAYDKIYELNNSFYQDPQQLRKEVVAAYQAGPVRAVKLNYIPASLGPNMGLTPDSARNDAATDVHYDYWQALMARAVLFAANRLPAARIVIADVGGSQWRIDVEGVKAASELTVRARDAWGRIYFDKQLSVATAGSVDIAGISLPPRTTVDFILRDSDGSVLDWYAAAVPESILARIDGVTLDKSHYALGETINAEVKAAAIEPGNYNLVVYLSDHGGRRLVRSQQAIDLEKESPTSIAFSLKVPESSNSLLMRIDAVLCHNTDICDTYTVDCPVPSQTEGDFYAAIPGGLTNRLTNRIGTRIMVEDFGVRLDHHQGKGFYGTRARDNLRQYEYTTALGYPATEETFAPWIEGWDEFLPKNLFTDLSKITPFRPLFNSLGEEHFLLLGASQHPLVPPRFQKYLKQQYASLAELNASWGSKYTSWDEVKMSTPHTIDVMNLNRESLAVDSRQFMESLFADKHDFLAKYLRREVPGVDVGIHIGWDLWMGRGYDYWKLSRAMEVMCGYEGSQNQYIRSFFKRYYGHYYHYELGDTDNARWNIWHSLLSGARGNLWYARGPGRWGALAADLQFSSDFAAVGEDFAKVSEIGQLLVRTEYQQDQVAIHYSQSSYHAGVSDLSWIHMRFINLLFDRGVPFQFVSYEELANDVVMAEKYRLLILPHSISVSDGEAQAIEKYVRAGGTVWADILPGAKDEHGNVPDENLLADLFADLKPLSLGEEHVLAGRAVGKGRVILGDIGNYGESRNLGLTERAHAFMSVVEKAASLSPVVRATDSITNKPIDGVWTAGYRKGNQRYVVMTKDYRLVDDQPTDATIASDRSAHWYRVRDGAYLGCSETINEKLLPTVGQAYALLPYRVEQLKVNTPNPATRGETLTINVQVVTADDVAVGADDIHLIWVTVHDPTGDEVIALRRHVPVMGGSGVVHLPVAWDDMPGNWIVTLRDAATGAIEKFAYELPSTH